jgi:hypothetical protein
MNDKQKKELEQKRLQKKQTTTRRLIRKQKEKLGQLNG